jgi:hypothetical protein
MSDAASSRAVVHDLIMEEPLSSDASDSDGAMSFVASEDSDEYVWKVDPRSTARSTASYADIMNPEKPTPGQTRMRYTIESLEKRAFEDKVHRERRQERKYRSSNATEAEPPVRTRAPTGPKRPPTEGRVSSRQTTSRNR